MRFIIMRDWIIGLLLLLLCVWLIKAIIRAAPRWLRPSRTIEGEVLGVRVAKDSAYGVELAVDVLENEGKRTTVIFELGKMGAKYYSIDEYGYLNAVLYRHLIPGKRISVETRKENGELWATSGYSELS